MAAPAHSYVLRRSVDAIFVTAPPVGAAGADRLPTQPTAIAVAVMAAIIVAAVEIDAYAAATMPMTTVRTPVSSAIPTRPVATRSVTAHRWPVAATEPAAIGARSAPATAPAPAAEAGSSAGAAATSAVTTTASAVTAAASASVTAAAVTNELDARTRRGIFAESHGVG